MKNKFLKSSINLVKNSYPDYTQEKLDEIAYGLEALYLTITKMVVIIILASILGILKECFILIISYNLLRFTAFGIHASKSIYCLISSLIFFIGGVYLIKYVEISFLIKVISTFISVFCIAKYAPADTEKRPLINSKRRKKYKIITSITAIIYAVLIIIFSDYIISNYLLLGMIEVVIMIHPLTYKIFGHSYNNYKTYKYAV